MRVIAGIGALSVVPAIIAYFVQCILNKKNKIDIKNKDFLYFYFVLFFCAEVTLKLLKGEWRLTVYESFMEMGAKTLLHYGIPFFVLSIIAPFVVCFISSKVTKRNIYQTITSYFILICLVQYLIFDRLTNLLVFIAAISSLVIALLMSIYVKKEVSKNSLLIKEKVKILLPIVFFWCVVCVFYLPNELFLGNISEFVYPYSTCLIITVAVSMVSFVVYLGLGCFVLDDSCIRLLGSILVVYTICCYIQVLFFNGRMSLLDGSNENWSILKTVVNITVWILIVIVMAYILIKYSVRPLKILGTVGALVASVQIVTIVTLIYSQNAFSYNNTPIALTNEKEFELSEEKNVIVFILDWFDTQIFDKVAEDPRMLEPLKDFTYYNNITGNYIYTDMALPFLLTGVEWNLDYKDEYTRYAYSKSSYLKDIADKGYNVGIYTYPTYVDYSCGSFVENMKVNSVNEVDIIKFAELYNKVSKYKTMPFIAKRLYRYSQGQLNRAAGFKDEFITWDDLSFYEPLIAEGLSINQDSKAYFKLYHLYGAHVGYMMTENFERPEVDMNGTEAGMVSQAKGSLKIVYEYMKQMKELGIYDDATIIITADHGQNFFAEGKYESLESCGLHDNTTNPILLIKTASSSQDKMVTSDVAFTQKNILATVSDVIGVNNTVYGDSIIGNNIGVTDTRVTEFYRDPDVEYKKYEIQGHVKEWNNWKQAE